jgi:hypothetical protein
LPRMDLKSDLNFSNEQKARECSTKAGPKRKG